MIKQLRSITPIDDLSGEFDSPYPLSACVQRLDAFENQHYEVRAARRPPLVFNVTVQEKNTDENGRVTATLGAYYHSTGDIVVSLELELTSNGDGTHVRYNCHLRKGLKNKLYIHLIVIFVLVVLTITTTQAILFFGIFFLITVYTISQEWFELKNVKQGLVTLAERELR